MKTTRRATIIGIVGFLIFQIITWVRMLFPRTRLEGARYLKVGKPNDFKIGVVDQRFLGTHKIWIVRDHEGIYALYARCTHLGCIPSWVPAIRKFKCPCHGSGFAMDGTNLEGPAPTPLERFRIFLDGEGNIVVDLAQKIHKKQNGKWSGPGALLKLNNSKV